MKLRSTNIFSGKNITAFRLAFCFTVIFFPGKMVFPQSGLKQPVTVDAGVASVDITPESPIRMAGYAARVSTETDSVLTRLSAKALALGSDSQRPSVLITVDLVGITWHITKNVANFLSREKGIDPSQIAICASHTHGGPEIGNLINILQYRPDGFTDSLLAPDQLNHIVQYTEWLTKKLIDVAIAALNDRRPAYISWGQGQALFAANRRTQGGPVDVALPILKIADTNGALRAVFVNYACHGTTLGGDMHKIHGDWIAEAHRLIEARHPGATALIALGTAGDANPAPRGTLEDVRTHGKEIADNVDKLLTAQLEPLNAPPGGTMEWVRLPLEKLPPVPELMKLSKENSIKGYEARLTLERLVRGGEILSAIDYPIQIWNFDNRMAMVNMAGEVVVDYSFLIKEKYGAERLWINAYANDVPCYIPSKRILREGGYEGETNMYWYDKPVPFAPAVEEMIMNTIDVLLPASFKDDRPAANRQELVRIGRDGAYHLKSWLAAAEGSRIQYMPEWKAFGWFDAKDKAIWEVDVEKKGKYDVYLKWSVSDAAAGKSFELIAGNKKIKGRVEKTGSWFTYHTKKIGSMGLQQGTVTVVLKSGSTREEGSMFDVSEVRLMPAK